MNVNEMINFAISIQFPELGAGGAVADMPRLKKALHLSDPLEHLGT